MKGIPGGSSSYCSAPGFGLERGRAECSTVGFAVGRGRASSFSSGQAPCPSLEQQSSCRDSPPSITAFLLPSMQRASEAFDHLLQFHSKRFKVEENPHSTRVAIPPIDKKPRAVGFEDELVHLASKVDQDQEQRKQKKNKRGKEVDSNRKKRRIEGVDA